MNQDNLKVTLNNPPKSNPEDANKPINNKEGRPFEHYNAQYRLLDPDDVAARCGVSLSCDKSEFQLNFIGNRYAVTFPEFTVRLIDKHTPSDQLSAFGPAQILIIRYLIEGHITPALGNFLTYREMPWGSVYNDNFTGRCIKRLAFAYGNSQETFKKVMEELGAKQIKGGDIAYELELIDGLFIRYLLWAGEDDIPPSSQILFSDNFSEAFTAEDMAVIGDVTINAMKETGKLI